MTPDLKNICLQICDLTKEVGRFIFEEQKNIHADTVETKSVNSLVTYVDKTAEQKLVDALRKIIPGSGFITEENTVDQSVSKEEFTWIIDPLDGTTNYIHGIPCYCISIGLKNREELIIGVIYEINLDECFYAWQGGKAYLNGKEIKTSATPAIKDSLIATGFPYYDYERMNEYMLLFQHFMQNSRGLRRLGSAAVDLAYVACGRFDSFYEYSLNPWDVAAGAFIVQQAGGKVSDFSGGKNFLFGKEIIATNAQTHQEFLKVVKGYFQ